jgi:HPt (histidine-containing phosphotransfer) domain-containing protein
VKHARNGNGSLTGTVRFATLAAVTVLDPAIAEQLAADLPRDVFLSIVQTFEVDLARLVREMVDAVGSTDPETYRRAAHGLAGAAGAIGARQLEALARLAMHQLSVPTAEQVLTLGEAARAARSELVLLATPRPASA